MENNKSDILKFYEVDNNYIQYLKKFEPKIPNFNYKNNNKFVCGIVLKINKCNYYVPVSSNKIIFKSSLPIYDKSKITSTLKFSFMFPIPNSCCSVKNFNAVNMPYKRLLQKELKYCNSIRDDIRQKAKDIYDTVINKESYIMVKNCCDFKLLEQKCIEYEQNRAQKQNQSLASKIKSAQQKANKINQSRKHNMNHKRDKGQEL